jgi:hypothetical protein
MNETIHFTTQGIVRCVPTKIYKTEQQILVAEGLTWVGTFLTGIAEVKLAGLSMVTSFINDHVLGILDEKHRGWRDFVKEHAMARKTPGTWERNNRATIWRQIVALGTDGVFEDEERVLHQYKISCDGMSEMPKIVPVYVTLKNSLDDFDINVNIPFFEIQDNCVYKETKLTRKRKEFDIALELNPNIKEEKKCRMPLLEADHNEADHHENVVKFKGNKLVQLMTDNYESIWKENPEYMSAASSCFPGMGASETMLVEKIRPFNESKNPKLKAVNRLILQFILGAVNSFGEALKKHVFPETTSKKYNFNVPNPNLAEHASSIHLKGVQVNLLDGGYVDNSGVVTCVYFMQKKYGSKKMPKIISLGHSGSFEKSMRDIEKLFKSEHSTFTDSQIFLGPFSPKIRKEFKKQCSDEKKSYCSFEVTAKTKENRNFGIEGGDTITMVLIFPLSFDDLPTLAMQHTKERFKKAFVELEQGKAIESSLEKFKETENAENVVFFKNHLKKIGNPLKSVGNALKSVGNTLKSVRAIPAEVVSLELMARIATRHLKKYARAAGKLIHAAITFISWSRNFPRQQCSEKYRNVNVYNKTVRNIFWVKDHITGYAEKSFYDTFQSAYEITSTVAKKFSDGTTKMKTLREIEVIFEKAVRFFPAAQHYLNPCGFQNTNQKMADLYIAAGKELVPHFIKKGYFEAVVNELAGIKLPKWTRFVGARDLFPRIFGTMAKDLRNEKCFDEIQEGMLTFYNDMMVRLLFQYASVEKEGDEYILERDVIKFGTTSSKDSNEHLATLIVQREMAIFFNDLDIRTGNRPD